jgi:IclR family pca regulon transcriptional regulator
MDHTATPDKDVVGGLEKGLTVIECFDEKHSRLSLTQVANMTGLTRAAARRYLITLLKRGYANFDGKFFSLTPRVLRLGYAYLSSSAVPLLVQPILERISEETGESSSAAALDGTDIVYIARSARRRVMSVDLGVGSRLPAYCTALGRVFLAFQAPQRTSDYFRIVTLRQLTPKTKHTEVEVRAALDIVRQQGFSVVDEELELGLRSIAVPVFDATGQLATAINISVHAVRLTMEELVERFLPVLTSAQQELRPLIYSNARL